MSKNIRLATYQVHRTSTKPLKKFNPADFNRSYFILRDTKFSPKDTGISYRQLNHWSVERLIDDNREEGTGWRKLNLVDLVWLRVVKELREFGLSLENLRLIKENLTSPANDKRNLRAAIVTALMQEESTLIIYPDGKAFAYTALNKHLNTNYDLSVPHIRLPLKKILESLFGVSCEPIKSPSMADLKEDNPASIAPNLTPRQMRVVELLRENDLRDVFIQFKDGEIEKVRKTKRFEGFKKIVELIQKFQTGDMNVKMNKGKVIFYDVSTQVPLPE